MKTITLSLLCAVAVAALAVGQDSRPAPIKLTHFQELGIRADAERFTYSLDFLEAPFSWPSREAQAPAGTKPKQPQLDILESWLGAELPKRVDGIRRVEFVQRRSRRYTADGETYQLNREMEVACDAAAAAKVQEIVSGLARSRHAIIKVSFVIATQRVTAQKDQGLDERDAAPAPQLMTKAQFDDRLAQLKDPPADKARAWTIMTAPSLALLNGQRGEIFVGNSTNYVKDYQVETVHEQKISVPIIDTVSDGVSLHVSTLVEPDGASVAAEIGVHMSWLTRPLRTFSITLEAGQSVTVELPELRTWAPTFGAVHTTPTTPCVRIPDLRTTDEQGTPITVEILARFEVEARASEISAGSPVLGTGRGSTVMFDVADRPALRGAKPGQIIEVRREDRPVGHFRIDRVEANVLITTRQDGELPTGSDELRVTDSR